MELIKVLKLNITGEVTWQYDGRVLRRTRKAVVLEAFFNRPDMPFLDVIFKEGDRFVETFYADRWYNTFEIHDRDDCKLKGWYCNVCRPTVIARKRLPNRTPAGRSPEELSPARGKLSEETISYVDLALDLWVSAKGKQTVLDEDEFEALQLDGRERQAALNALAELKKLFESKQYSD